MAAWVAAAMLLTGCAQGEPSSESAADALTVGGAFTPEPATSDIAAAYLTITNDGEADDALIGAETDVAASVELHESVVEDGLARMQPRDEIPVPAGGETELARGGRHLMLVDPEPLAEGAHFELTLRFAEAGEITTEVAVVSAAGPDQTSEGHDDHDD